MSAAQQKHSPIDPANPATVWVINTDAQVRRLVDNVVQQYPLHLSLCVIFSEDFRPDVTAPPPDVVLVNLTAPTKSCLSLLPEIRRHWPDTHVIVLSPSDEMHLWSEAIRLGAYDFLPRSVDCHQLGWVLQDALWTNRRTIPNPPVFPSLKPATEKSPAVHDLWG